MKRPIITLFLYSCFYSLVLQAQSYDTTYYQDQFRQIRSILLDSSDASQAMALLEQLPPFEDTLTKENRLLQAKKKELICRCHYSKGQYKQAIQNCQKALSLQRDILGEVTTEVGELYSLLGRIYGSQGKTKEGLAANEKAYAIFTKLYGESHPKTSIYQRNLGGKYIMDAQPDELAQKGYQYLTEALEVQLQEWGENNINTAITLHYLGKYFNRQGQYYKALDYQKRALQIYAVLGKGRAPLAYYMYRVIGLLYQRLGDYKAAEDYLEIALEGNEARLGKDHAMLSLDYYALWVVCKNANRFDQAAEYLHKAIALISRKYGPEHIGLPHMYEGLGQLLIEKGDYQQGIDMNQKALAIWQSHYSEPTQNFTFSLHNIATAYQMQGAYTTAISYYEQALQIYRQTNGVKVPQVANVYIGMANAYASLQEMKKARDHFDLALATIDFRENGDHFAQVQSFTILMNALTSYGQFLKEWSVIEKSEALRNQSIQMYDLAFQALDQMHLEIQSPESQQFIQKEAIGRLFEPLIVLDVEQQLDPDREGSPEKSFKVAERSKALSLLMSANKSNAYQFDENLQVLVEKEEEIRAAIKEREQYLANEKAKAAQADAQTIASLNEQLNYYRKQFYANLATLERKYPDYYQLKHQVEVYGVSQARALLPPEPTALLEYFVGDDSIYAFVITHDLYQVVSMPVDPDLHNWISALREQMINFSPFGGRSGESAHLQADHLSEILHHIYQSIFAPIEAQLDLPEQLIIVPDGVLGYVPFEMLLRQMPNDPTLYAGYAYLIKDYQISYTYSATLLGQIKTKKKSRAKGAFLAFAPAFNQGEDASEDQPLLSSRGDLGPLLYNVPEAESLQQLMGGEAFIGDQATEEAFLQHASDYRIIHLATHAKADDLVGDYAYLAFEEIPDSIENELLYNRELYQLDLEADMVVLSACETGTGELQRGEGIISLARGFSYAGAKSIITTLWSVDDQKTKHLMEGFYAYIKAGLPKDAALRQAKLDFIDQYSHDAHPFYWAAFIPIGDMSSINFQTNSSIWKWGLGAFMLLIIALFYFRQTRLQ